MDSKQLEFDNAYWASQPPELVALSNQTRTEDRSSRAAELAMKGFIVDVPIMVWGWDPYLVMKMRQDFGYTWVPAALQPQVSIAPGLSAPGVVPYDPLHPSPGSIHVSTDQKDYPPFEHGVPAPLAAIITDPVGPQSLGNIYLTVAGDNHVDGDVVESARGKFLKHVVVTPFGRSGYWELIPKA